MNDLVLKGVLGKIVLKEDRILIKSKEIMLSDITNIKFSKGNFKTNGYIVFCTGDGIGEAVHNLQQASRNKNGIGFWYTQNEMAELIISNIGAPNTEDNEGVTYNIRNKQSKLEEKKLKEEIRLVKEQRKQAERVAKCPKCGSTSLSANKKGFGIGKAVVGGMVAGPFGLMAGNINAKKVWVTCLNCGKRFKL